MNDYLDYLAHYRTPGSKNGISHTPGYDAVGKPAMSEAERREAYKKLSGVEKFRYNRIKDINKKMNKIQNKKKLSKGASRKLEKLQKIKNYEENATEKQLAKEWKARKRFKIAVGVGAGAAYIGAVAAKEFARTPAGRAAINKGRQVISNMIRSAKQNTYKTTITDANGKILKRYTKPMYSQAANIGTGLIRR